LITTLLIGEKANDNDGNMTTGYTPEGYALAMTYDAQNRMKTAQYTDDTGKVNLFEYAYAGTSLLDQLVKKENTVPVSTTKYVRSGFLPIQERDGSNAITRDYTWGKNLGGGIGGLLNLKQNNQDYSYLYDGKGNVSALIDSTQAVVASYAYDPFGMLMKDTSATGFDQPYKFSTKQQITGTGLISYGYRFYDSCSSKWTTRDPLGEYADLNVYRMVGNNTVSFLDPLGLYDVDVHLGWTYIWASAAGFSANDALTIATANQGVDEGLSNPFLWPLGATALHFMSRQEAAAAVEQAIQQGNLKLFGRALHMFQDSYSHAGYRAYPSCEIKNGKLRGKFGHIQDGHDPDKYVESSQRDTAMRNQTMEYLLKFLKRKR